MLKLDATMIPVDALARMVTEKSDGPMPLHRLTLQTIKQKAKKLRKLGVANHMKCLEAVAIAYGFADYKAFRDSLGGNAVVLK